jgi:DNA polymerase I-like protein with 3'-5' exonuclease and polymerase domains
MTALVSGDDNFAAALSAASDFHSTMAEIYFGDAFRRATGAERDLLRRKAKNFTFGMLYGMGAAGLAKAAGRTAAARL